MTPSIDRSARFTQTRSAAVAVRVTAFVLSLVAILSIPTVVVATTTGRLTSHVALCAVCGAVALIGLAAAIVRPFDPLRQ